MRLKPWGNAEQALYLGSFRGRPVFAAEGILPDGSPNGVAFLELRSLFGQLETGLYEIALLGEHLIEWDIHRVGSAADAANP